MIPLVALMSSFGPVTAPANLGTTLQATAASGARVLAILDEEPETEDVTGCEPIVYRGAAMENVTFSYGSEPVLRGFTAAFPENRIVGLVGKSGCGKSTAFFAADCDGDGAVTAGDARYILRVSVGLEAAAARQTVMI